jgi:hypothetical protein
VYSVGFFGRNKGDEGLYCWVRFDTNLLAGIGWEGRGFNDGYDDEADILTKNGTWLNVKDLYGLHYAQARGNFISSSGNERHNSLIRTASEVQKERDAPAIVFVFTSDRSGASSFSKTVARIEGERISIIEKGKIDYLGSYIIADASNIPWFAYNQ